MLAYMTQTRLVDGLCWRKNRKVIRNLHIQTGGVNTKKELLDLLVHLAIQRSAISMATLYHFEQVRTVPSA